MRKIIERIALEDTHDNSNFVVIKNKKFMSRERSWSNASNNLQRNISTKTNSIAQVSDNEAKDDCESDDIDGDAPVKCIQPIEPQCIQSIPDHLDSCLQYWQDIIYPTSFKA